MDQFFDKYTVQLSRLFMGRQRWFSRNCRSLTIREHVDQIQTTLPEISGEGFFEVSQQSAVGDLDPAFHIAQWLGSAYPTIIYHHGNNETPFNYGAGSKNTFKSILFSQKTGIRANLIALRAPFHNDGLKKYMQKIGDLNLFAAMLAGSVGLVEALIQALRQMGVSRIICSGVSLGGWVTNLHRAFYNTADCYVPICAGAALDDVFLNSAYRKITAKNALQQPEVMTKVLNFTSAFATVTEKNVFPLLARHDQIIRYAIQKQCYTGHQVTTLDKGHVTCVLKPALLREHILAQLSGEG